MIWQELTNEEFIELWNKTVSITELAREFNVSPATVYSRGKRLGLENPKRRDKGLDKEVLEDMEKYSLGAIGLVELSEKWGIKVDSVKKKLHRAGAKVLKKD